MFVFFGSSLTFFIRNHERKQMMRPENSDTKSPPLPFALGICWTDGHAWEEIGKWDLCTLPFFLILMLIPPSIIPSSLPSLCSSSSPFSPCHHLSPPPSFFLLPSHPLPPSLCHSFLFLHPLSLPILIVRSGVRYVFLYVIWHIWRANDYVSSAHTTE